MLKLFPNWRKLAGGLLLTVLVGANTSALAQDILNADQTIVPQSLISMGTNIGFGLIISYMWQADAKRKDEFTKMLLEDHREEKRLLLAQLERNSQD